MYAVVRPGGKQYKVTKDAGQAFDHQDGVLGHFILLPAGADDRARRHRAFSLVVVGMSVAVWWPAFTLGAWHDLFFDQQLVAGQGVRLRLVSRGGKCSGGNLSHENLREH